MVAVLEVPEKLYTVEEWLALERRSEVRHEYVYGKLIPMAGEAKRANILAGNVKKRLDDPLYERGFQIYDHDVKAEVVPDGIFRYPDLVAAPIVDDEDDFIVKYPVFMAEVASEDSMTRDRVKKRKQYFEIPSLWYYLIIAQDDTWVELHTRRPDGSWGTQYFTEPTDELHFERFGLTLKLSQIYERVKIKHP